MSIEQLTKQAVSNQIKTRKRGPRIVVLLLTVMILCSLALMQAPVAHAGNNGQELQITCPRANVVVVIGTNQKDDPVTQTFYPDSNGSSTFTTIGNWFSGNIMVLWYGNGTQGNFHDVVPQQQDSDVYSTSCTQPPAQYNAPANLNPTACDPSTTTDPSAIQDCLELAPAIPCPDAPCIPYLASGYIVSSGTNTIYCLMQSFASGINPDDPFNPEANVLNRPSMGWTAGDTAYYTYVWGFDYKGASGTSYYQIANGVPDLSYTQPQPVPIPLLVWGSHNVYFTCDGPSV